MSATRNLSGLSPNATQRRSLKDSTGSFASSFVICCRLWLAANSIWATLLVAACFTVSLRLRIDRSWLFTALVVLLSTGLGLRELWKSAPGLGLVRLRTLLTLALGLFSAGYLLWPCLTKGAFVSVTGDTFFYGAFGQYLTDHHRGIEFGLPPIDQYATLLSETRFGTASILGFLAVLFHKSTAAILPLYVFLILFNIFAGFVLLSRRFGCSRLLSLAAGLFAVVAGWTPNALIIGGLDNLLFLSLFPFLLVRLELYRFGSKTWPESLGLSTLGAALFYAYPEGLCIAGAIFLPLFCKHLWSGMYRGGAAWRGYLVSACLLLAFISPHIWLFFTSLFANIGIHLSKGAAGIFPGLLSPRFFPAMFGLGQEYPGTFYSLRDLGLPLLMLAFIVLGLASWIGGRKILILAFLVVIIMAIWQGSLLQYDYGLYKILFIGSLVWIPSLFRGGTVAARLVMKPVPPLGVSAAIMIFFVAVFAARMEQQEKIPWRVIRPLKWYSDLAGIRHIVGNRPVLLVCDSAFDRDYNEFDQEWSVFFLRQVSLKIPTYYGYLGGFGSFMQRAKSPNEEAAFVLVNDSIEGAIWRNERFSLLALGSPGRVIGVQGASPEYLNGKPFVWLRSDPTRFLVVSNTEQTANFLAWPSGPHRSEEHQQQIRVSIDGKSWQASVSRSLSIEVPLKSGLNYLDIARQDPSVVPAQSEDDPKVLPFGLWDYRIGGREEVLN
jgi:hypothetical protein